MRIFFFSLSTLIMFFSFAAVVRALDFTPFADGSIYACTQLSNGKPAIGVRRASGYGVTVDFAAVKSKLKDKLKTNFQRRRALRNLLSKLQDDKKASKTLLREFYAAYKELFDTVNKNLAIDQKIEALQQLLPRADSLIDGIGVELKALQACKANKAPTSSGFTYKVFVSAVDGTSIFVIVTTSAKGIDPNQIYCGEVPVVGSTTTRFISGRLFPNPCSPIGCVAETGAGNVGLLVTSLRTSSTQTRDENLGTYQATYSGSLALRKIKEGDPCN
jgi:hypothetical protein